MRELTLDAPSKLPRLSILNYGDTRSGKTTFSGSFPRTLVIADTTENGWKSALTMDHETYFEPDREPIVWGIDKMNDLVEMYGRMDPLIASGKVCTVVFDAFTFYCDFFLAGIIRSQQKFDQRAAYGDLGRHLREVRVQLQQRGATVIYNCLAKHPNDDDPKGRPLIPGGQQDKFSAGVDMLFYSRVDSINKQEVREIRTRQYMKYIAGHREGINADRLPDPFSGTYSDLVTCLGYDPDQIRESLPKINGAKTVVVSPVKPVAAKAPPVVIRSQAPSGAKQ